MEGGCLVKRKREPALDELCQPTRQPAKMAPSCSFVSFVEKVPMSADRWIADRMRHIESSGIRKVFELARSLKDPVNLSISQPDFDVPEPIKAAAHAAIDRGANAYTVTQGIPELPAKIHADIQTRY